MWRWASERRWQFVTAIEHWSVTMQFPAAGRRIWLALAGLVVASITVATSAAIPPGERIVLTAIYLGTNGDNWTTNTNWCDGTCPLSGAPTFSAAGTECTWFGVWCDGTNSHVWGVFLDSKLFDPIQIARARTGAQPLVTLCLSNPTTQRFRRTADLCADRSDRRPLRTVLVCALAPSAPLAPVLLVKPSLTFSWLHPLKG